MRIFVSHIGKTIVGDFT